MMDHQIHILCDKAVFENTIHVLKILGSLLAINDRRANWLRNQWNKSTHALSEWLGYVGVSNQARLLGWKTQRVYVFIDELFLLSRC